MSAEEERVFWDAVDPSVDYERCIFDGPPEYGLDRVLAAMPPEGPWFDLGCGTGRLANAATALSRSLQVIGYDISWPMVDAAGRQSPAGGWFQVCDGRTIPAPDESFAGGWSVLLFQHLEPEAVRGYLGEVARVLRPGGRFVFQFADDGYGVVGEGPYAWSHDPVAVRQWCRDAGLRMFVGSDDDLYPTWFWQTVEKP